MTYPMSAHGIAYEALIGGIGAPCLAATVLSVADAEIGADEVFAYALDGPRPPRPIASSSSLADYSDRASNYTSRFHRLDPALRLTAEDGHDMRMAQIGAEDIDDRDYRRLCYDLPAFAEKLSYACRFNGGAVVLSIYRRRGRKPCGIADLRGFAEMVLPIICRHGEIVGAFAGETMLQRLEARMALQFSDLSARELAVCGRTLIGMTAEAIGLELGIRTSTVLTYRRRAYERYGISNANQLLPKLLC